jgi:hypothetical protein
VEKCDNGLCHAYATVPFRATVCVGLQGWLRPVNEEPKASGEVIEIVRFPSRVCLFQGVVMLKFANYPHMDSTISIRAKSEYERLSH